MTQIKFPDHQTSSKAVAQKCSVKKVFSKNFVKPTGKNLSWRLSFFMQALGLQRY